MLEIDKAEIVVVRQGGRYLVTKGHPLRVEGTLLARFPIGEEREMREWIDLNHPPLSVVRDFTGVLKQG